MIPYLYSSCLMLPDLTNILPLGLGTLSIRVTSQSLSVKLNELAMSAGDSNLLPLHYLNLVENKQ